MESIYENSALATQEIMLEAEVYTPVRRYAGAKTGKRYEFGMFSEIFREIWGGTKRTLAGLILIAGSLNLLFSFSDYKEKQDMPRPVYEPRVEKTLEIKALTLLPKLSLQS